MVVYGADLKPRRHQHTFEPTKVFTPIAALFLLDLGLSLLVLQSLRVLTRAL